MRLELYQGISERSCHDEIGSLNVFVFLCSFCSGLYVSTVQYHLLSFHSRIFRRKYHLSFAYCSTCSNSSANLSFCIDIDHFTKSGAFSLGGLTYSHTGNILSAILFFKSSVSKSCLVILIFCTQKRQFSIFKLREPLPLFNFKIKSCFWIVSIHFPFIIQ